MTPESDDLLTIQAAAKRLGVSRWRVWQLVADGAVDVQPVRVADQTVTRVRLPAAVNAATDADPPTLPPTRSAQLAAQVDKLAHTLQFLSAMVTELSHENARLRDELKAARGSHPTATVEPVAPLDPLRYESAAAVAPRHQPSVPSGPQDAERSQAPKPVVQMIEVSPLSAYDVPVGITARPNPMTHPASAIRRTAEPDRDQLFAPVQELFSARDRRGWWGKRPG